MSQFARPDSDLTVGVWNPVGGPTDLFECLNESIASDTDYIEATILELGACELGLSNVTDPQTSGGHTMRIRAKVSSGGTFTRVTLLQGGTPRAVFEPVLTTSFALYTYTLTVAEANSITDYSDLRVKFEDLTDSSSYEISWFELEVPDPPIVAALGPALETDIARPLVVSPKKLMLGLALEVDSAGTFLPILEIHWSIIRTPLSVATITAP